METETEATSLRLTKAERKDLKKEAKAEFMTLAGYLRKLVITHPERKKR